MKSALALVAACLSAYACGDLINTSTPDEPRTDGGAVDGSTADATANVRTEGGKPGDEPDGAIPPATKTCATLPPMPGKSVRCMDFDTGDGANATKYYGFDALLGTPPRVASHVAGAGYALRFDTPYETYGELVTPLGSTGVRIEADVLLERLTAPSAVVLGIALRGNPGGPPCDLAYGLIFRNDSGNLRVSAGTGAAGESGGLPLPSGGIHVTLDTVMPAVGVTSQPYTIDVYDVTGSTLTARISAFAAIPVACTAGVVRAGIVRTAGFQGQSVVVDNVRALWQL